MLDNLPRIPRQPENPSRTPARRPGRQRRRPPRRRAAPLLILTADAQSAQRLQAEAPFFAPALRVALLPDWETLPYDHFSPHGELVSERLATLWQIHQRECDVIIAPVGTAMTRLAPISYLLGRTFFLQAKGWTWNSCAPIWSPPAIITSLR